MKNKTRLLSLILCFVMLFTANSMGVEATSVKVSVTEKLVAEATSGSVELRWRKVSKATGYKIYQRVDGKWKAIKTVKTNKYTVDDLTAGENYKFAVKTYRKTGGKTYWSNKYKAVSVTTEKMGKTPKPKATATKNTVTLKWEEVEGATGYRVYQYSPSKDKYVVKASVKGKTSYKITSLKENGTYKFKIKPYAKTSKGTVWNKASSAVTIQTIDKTKAKFTDPVIGSKGVTLNWGKVSGATAYRLYMKQDGEWVKIASGIKKTSYKVERLESGTEYIFMVRAYKKVNGKVNWYTKSDELKVITKTSGASATKPGEESTTESSTTEPTTKPTTTEPTTKPTTEPTTKPTTTKPTTTKPTTTKPTTTEPVTTAPTTESTTKPTTTKPTTTESTTTKPTTTKPTTTKPTTTKPTTTKPTTTEPTTTKPTTTKPTTTKPTTTKPTTTKPTTTQPTTQPVEELKAYRVAKYKEILDKETIYFEISGEYSEEENVPITFARKDGNMYMETTAEGITMKMYYEKKTNKMHAYAYLIGGVLPLYYEVPENEMKDMDIEEVLDTMVIKNIGDITVSRAIFDGKVVICESFVDSFTGNSLKYFFDGETLVGFDRKEPKKSSERIYVNKISNSVSSSIFERPSRYIDISGMM